MEKDILISGENDTLSIKAFTEETDAKIGKDLEISEKMKLYDKTIVLPVPVDFEKMKMVFFLSCLEVTITDRKSVV